MEESAEQMRQTCKQVMGDDPGALYADLWQQLAWLHIRWAGYVELFGSKPETFGIMNQVAGGFFKNVQDDMWQSILMHLCRLTDRREMNFGKRTLSVDAFRPFQKDMPDVPLLGLIDTAMASTQFARTWRNDAGAHKRRPPIDGRSEPLTLGSRDDVRRSLDALRRVLNAVEWKFLKSDTRFDMSNAGASGGLYLLRSLRLVERLRQERKERIASGNIREDDLDYKKWRGLED